MKNMWRLYIVDDTKGPRVKTNTNRVKTNLLKKRMKTNNENAKM